MCIRGVAFDIFFMIFYKAGILIIRHTHTERARALQQILQFHIRGLSHHELFKR